MTDNMRKYQFKRSFALFLAAALVIVSVSIPSKSTKAATVKQIQLTAPYTTKGEKISTTLTLKKGQSFRIKTKVFPKKAGKLTYKSSKKKIASVNKKGKIIAKKIGKAKITIRSKKSKKIKATIKVTVVKSLKKVKKIKLNKKSLTLTLGSQPASAQLKATITSPKKPTVKKFNWYSTDKAVASVNSKGVVTAKKTGTAKIFVTSADGRGAKASCLVSVYRKSNPTPSVKPSNTATPSAKPSSSGTPLPSGTPSQPTATANPGAINSVTIKADRDIVSSMEPLTLSAELDTTGTPSEALTWSIQNPIEGVSLASTTGSSNTLSVTSSVAAETKITVRATSDFDPGKYGEIVITVKKFDINKLDVEYFENFDASDATLDTIQESGVLSWKFTDPDANFSPNLNNSRSVKLRNNYGVHVAKPSLTFLQRQTYSFQGFFGSKEDYVQFKVENKEESEKTYNLSLMFRFIDIDADNSYIKEQMISDSSFVSYQLPLKLVAVDENEGETTVTNDIKIPFRCSQWTSGNMEYYDITGSVKIPAGKTVRLRLMLDGDLPQCLSPEHAAKGEGYDKMPHPCSFMIDNVAISTGEMNTITIKTGEDYQLNLDTLATDTVFYYTNCLAAQLTHSDYETDCTRFDVIPATVDDKGKITTKAPGDTVLMVEITHQDGSITRKQCLVHVEE